MSCDAWPIRWACDVDSIDQELLDAAASAAQTVLWGLTGRRYGLCPTTEAFAVDCTTPCSFPFYGDAPLGVRYAYDVGYGWGAGRVWWWDDGRCRVQLSRSPVREVVEVRVNGDVLPANEWELDRAGLLRLREAWPCTGACDTPAVEVDYVFGVDLPPMAALAMGELACEMLAALQGRDCQLPSNVTSVVRQGTTITLGDATTLFNDGRTGLPVCDAFIHAVNPNRLKQKFNVRSVDMARRAR